MPRPFETLRVTFLGLTALAVAVGIGRFAFTPLLEMMQGDGSVDVAGGGWLAAAHFLGYWLGAVSAAMIPVSPRTMLRLSLLAIAVGTWVMGAVESYAAWLAVRWLAGVCSAWALIAIGTHVIAHLAHTDGDAAQGRVFSGVGAGICMVGLAALVFMVNGIASAESWRILGVAALAASLLLWFSMGPELPSEPADPRGSPERRGRMDRRIVIAYGVAGLGYIIPATYLPLMAREIAAAPLQFGWAWPVFGAAACASTLWAAGLRKRMSNRRLWAFCQMIMAVGLMAPALHAHMTSIVIAGLAVGGTFMIITMAGIREVHRTAPTGDALRQVAVMTTAFATGQMAGPPLAGLLYDLSGGFGAALVAAGAALVVTGYMLAAPSRSRRRSTRSTPDPGRSCS